MNLNYLLKALSRRKLLLILIPLITLALAYFLTRNLKDQFRSKAQLATGFTTSDEIVKANENKIDENQSDQKFNNVLETLNSPKVVSFLSYSLIIHDLTSKTPFTRLKAKDLQNPLYKRVNQAEAIKIYKNHLDSLTLLNSYLDNERDLIEFLKLYNYDYQHLVDKIFNVNRVGHTDFIDVTATTEDPELSAFVANTLCKEFLQYYGINQSAKTVSSIDALAKVVAEKKIQLKRKTDSLTQFKQSHGVFNIDQESRNKSDQIKDYNIQLTEAEQNNQHDRLELRDVVKQLQDMGDNPVENSKPSVSSGNQEIMDINDKLKVLRSQQLSHSGNQDRITKEISDLTSQLANLYATHKDPGGDVVNTGATEHDRLVARKHELEVRIAASDQSILDYHQKINSLSAGYGTYAASSSINNSLQNEVDIAESELKAASNKYNEAKNMVYDISNANIKQSLQAQPAVEPEPSKRLLIIGIAAVTSFLLCVFVIILLEYLDTSIKTPFIFSKEVGLPLLGVINQVNLKKESLDELLVKGNESEKVNPEFRDFLKKIRYELDKKNSKLFLFTSNKPGEGKTTIITALSMVLASINKRILLIDTNFSHNSLTQLFGSTLALEDFGNLDFDEHYEVISKMIGKTSNKNIDIIGCKGGNYSPSEIFLKRGFFSALSKLTIYYDYIFLEGANLNQYADSKELAEFSDSVISVFSAKSVIKQSDNNSIAFLKELKDSFGGAILNNVELENIDY